MVLRIHFTAEDLARTRLADRPRPLLELGSAIRLLQKPTHTSTHPVCFDAWRNRAFTRLSPRVRTLFELIPASGWSLDFLTPEAYGDPAELLEEVRRTPSARLRADLAEWAEQRPRIPRWTRRLMDEPRQLQRLVDTMEHAYDQVIAPYWTQIEQHARTDRAVRMRQLTEEGLAGLLGGLNPRYIRWDPPVLEVTLASGLSGDLPLCGRGLLLVPSYFESTFPVVNDADPQPWIVFPICVDENILVPLAATTESARAGVPQSLTALLGRTRATVLRAIADHPGCTTSELADHARIATASASEHATILRGAGLTTSSRHRNSVLHTPTAAGISLLNAATY
ncbi:helix-turn-helix transcriptional regulator [Streptomyces sp. SAJ15]|uniref:ArsR/SmtB family transcription factor n=1 Tax=Streptomyces sp. SAJ15 TaxID=2011095 RepID=UPI00118728C1|nr:winged helix-turn-helix domain-containing protein [Streptomyces sp. SAJ15]TVL91917.1 ArsR family transcriptional regulator [Streptomyces sp. SAJ15]